MTENNKKKKSALSTVQENPGMFSGLSSTLRLVLRLMGDSRVSIFIKLLPIGSLVYLVSPLDAVIPVIDDALIIGLGTYFFIELCPPDVVDEHRARIEGTYSAPAATQNSEVINGIYTESDNQE
jgi:uncharacterized membrane protein YkvA (DUF1232 family)